MLKSIGESLSSLGGIPSSEKGQPNGVATLDANGKLPPGQLVYASFNAVAQAANIGATTVYAVPVGGAGLYRVSAYAVVTQAATTSSTLPNVGVLWTDNDANVALSANTVTPTNTANAPGAFGPGDIVISARGGTNIQFQTSNYASSGATPMQYAVHLRVEYLG
jgi:hypothetical protein